MPLIKDGALAEDHFAFVADDAALPDGPVVVSLKRLRADRDALFARNQKLGVKLTSEESPEGIGSDLDRLSLVVLEFPKFRDGRPFSWARILRTRLKFAGEIRAVGDYLYDQVAYLSRVGVNAFELPPSITPELFARALTEMTNVYQPAADGKKTIRDLRAG
ncbi:uncharacterized protein (DUF934 family) [Rhizomicrobium palustre]|uniref:Uncharacterized protein (DUF934 family) n=1 Tax=Rhizomicrobium palustre TaxID=189966 RepID=A0A846MWE1_9PROT|nr:DUF934 domain-containing protein [Rhizomicrobium palustre]NIK87663.1 uncharacterized protein (DUF934 family) [Rhizomicrobium palustre]